jgi:hypothetical protein
MIKITKSEWHKWFAWYPCWFWRQDKNEKIFVWLEYIGRKEVMGYWFPFYIYDPLMFRELIGGE